MKFDMFRCRHQKHGICPLEMLLWCTHHLQPVPKNCHNFLTDFVWKHIILKIFENILTPKYSVLFFECFNIHQSYCVLSIFDVAVVHTPSTPEPKNCHNFLTDFVWALFRGFEIHQHYVMLSLYSLTRDLDILHTPFTTLAQE